MNELLLDREEKERERTNKNKRKRESQFIRTMENVASSEMAIRKYI